MYFLKSFCILSFFIELENDVFICLCVLLFFRAVLGIQWIKQKVQVLFIPTTPHPYIKKLPTCVFRWWHWQWLFIKLNWHLSYLLLLSIHYLGYSIFEFSFFIILCFLNEDFLWFHILLYWYINYFLFNVFVVCHQEFCAGLKLVKIIL